VPALKRLRSVRFLGHGFAAADAKWNLSDPVVIVNNGVAMAPLPPRDVAWARRRLLSVLFVSTLEETKGVDVLVRTASLANQSNFPVRWPVAGEWV